MAGRIGIMLGLDADGVVVPVDMALLAVNRVRDIVRIELEGRLGGEQWRRSILKCAAPENRLTDMRGAYHSGLTCLSHLFNTFEFLHPTTKSPRPAPRALPYTAGFSSPADLDSVSRRDATTAAAGNAG